LRGQFSAADLPPISLLHQDNDSVLPTWLLSSGRNFWRPSLGGGARFQPHRAGGPAQSCAGFWKPARPASRVARAAHCIPSASPALAPAVLSWKNAGACLFPDFKDARKINRPLKMLRGSIYLKIQGV
jgi:hypothetical protein